MKIPWVFRALAEREEGLATLRAVFEAEHEAREPEEPSYVRVIQDG